MEPSSNKRTLTIDGMTGDACVQKVRTALNGVAGVATESVKVGSCTILCAQPAQCDAACAAIEAAGYHAVDARSRSQANGEGHSKSSAPHDSKPPQSKASDAMTSEGAGGAIDKPATTEKPVDHTLTPTVKKPAEPAVATTARKF